IFFFFQAEDGIRDLIVTGVQTCALPISSAARAWRHRLGRRRNPARCRQARAALGRSEEKCGRHRTSGQRWSAVKSRRGAASITRSEERRVGKEGGWRRVMEYGSKIEDCR